MPSTERNLDPSSAHLDAICAQFSDHLQSGGDANVEVFLPSDGSLDSNVVFESLFTLLLAHDRSHGRWLSREDYQARYRGYETIIDRSFQLAVTIAAGPGITHADGVFLKCDHCGKQWLVPKTKAEAEESASCPECDARVSVDDEGIVASRIPERIDRFEIQRLLGEGSFGEVYKAYDPKLAKTVAIKVPVRGTLRTQTQRQRFLLDAQASSRLIHANIVRATEIVLESERSDVPIIVADYIEGCTLEDLQVKEPMDPRESAKTIAVIARALHYAHQNGVIHRDIKPSNIILDKQKQPHVLDFGVAFMVDDRTRLTRMTMDKDIIGTPMFMPPEQIGQNGEPRAQNDIYSLGAVLFRLITGRHVYPEGTVLADLTSREPPPRPSRFVTDIPRDLDQICWKCLQKDPDQRFDSAEVLAEELERFAAGLPLQARYPGNVSRGLSFLWRHRVLVTIVALVVLVCGLAVNTVMLINRIKESGVRLSQTRQAAKELEVAKRHLNRWRSALIAGETLSEGQQDLGLTALVGASVDDAEFDRLRNACAHALSLNDPDLSADAVRALHEFIEFSEDVVTPNIRAHLKRVRGTFGRNNADANRMVDELLQ